MITPRYMQKARGFTKKTLVDRHILFNRKVREESKENTREMRCDLCVLCGELLNLSVNREEN